MSKGTNFGGTSGQLDPDILKKLDEFQLNYLNGLNQKPDSKAPVTKRTTTKSSSQNKTSANMYLPMNPTKKRDRLDKIIRNLNNDYVQQLKETEIKARNSKDLYSEMDKCKKQLEAVKRTNRDEDLLKMQKENQEIEEVLKELKKIDKSELRQKEDESRKLMEELNFMFNEKKKEAFEKDEVRRHAIEEIKQIKKQQEELKKLNQEARVKQQDLIREKETLDQRVESFNNYKIFIDKVIEKMNESSANCDYDKLKEKFENLIERMQGIKLDIEAQEKEIQDIKRQKNELIHKNNKQEQNKRLVDLEEETKNLIRENKELELEIEEIVNKNQKNDSDTHQIKLSINNLYNKVKENSAYDKNIDENNLCDKLTVIEDRIGDLIKIHKALEKFEKK
jgi:hypothetical protein